MDTSAQAGQELEAQQGWLAFFIEEGLRQAVLTPTHLLAHVTPEVLAERLPRDLMVKVFASAFSTGKLTPEGILSVAPPTTLVRHVAPAVLWAAGRAAAERHQLSTELPIGASPVRHWLGEVLGRGLEAKVVAPADVLRHAPPATWVGEAPREVVSAILADGLAGPAFDPPLLLTRMTPALLGEFAPTARLWACLDEAATRALSLDAA